MVHKCYLIARGIALAVTLSIKLYAWVTPDHESTTTCKSVESGEIGPHLGALGVQTPCS